MPDPVYPTSDPYISELRYKAPTTADFAEVVVDEGADVSTLKITVYNQDGEKISVTKLSDLTPTTMYGKDVYVVDYDSSNEFDDSLGISTTTAVVLSDNSGIYQFISTDDGGTPTVTATEGVADGLTSTTVGSALDKTLISTDGGNTYYESDGNTKGTIPPPCLTRGTIVQTDQGGVLVENLTKGMNVQTVDGDFMPLRMAIRKRVSACEMRKNPKLYPIRICAGALGLNLPSRDLLVSRQHRMLVSSRIAKRMFGVDEVLVAAIKLTTLPGVYQDESVEWIEYFHLVFDAHHVIFAENSPTESLYLGSETLKILSQEALEEILTLFPNLLSMNCAPNPAALIPKGNQQKNLIARHVKNNRAVLEDFRTYEKTRPSYSLH